MNKIDRYRSVFPVENIKKKSALKKRKVSEKARILFGSDEIVPWPSMTNVKSIIGRTRRKVLSQCLCGEMG
jgi:hypothetical protein